MGVILYELIMKKHPYNENSLSDLEELIVAYHYEPLPEAKCPKMSSIIEQMLSKDEA